MPSQNKMLLNLEYFISLKQLKGLSFLVKYSNIAKIIKNSNNNTLIQ